MADCDSAWEGSQKLKIGAPKRLFRVGGVTKVGGPTPRNGDSAWEGPQNLYIGSLPIVRLWRLLPCTPLNLLETRRDAGYSRTLNYRTGAYAAYKGGLITRTGANAAYGP